MIKKTIALSIFPLIISAADLQAAAMTCTDPSGSCAKFDIPGAFPGNFYIDFTHTRFSHAIIFGGMDDPSWRPEQGYNDAYYNNSILGFGFGSLSTDSQIHFSILDQHDTGNYNLSVDPEGFQFVDLYYGQSSTTKLGLHAIGKGTGTFNVNTGSWDLVIPTLLAINSYKWYVTGNMHFSTSNENGSAMIMDETDTRWGELTISTGFGTMAAPTNVDELLLSSLTTGIYKKFNPVSRDELYLSFEIQGVDPVSEVPVPAAAWLLGSGLIGLASIARRKK